MTKAWLQRELSVWALLFALGTFSSPQFAQADARDDQARALFEAGIAASRQGRWSDARELFERSQSLVEKPSTLLNLAIAQVNLGLGRDALATLSALDKTATPSEHAKLLERARALRDEAHTLVLAAAHSELFHNLPLEGEAKTELDNGVLAYGEGRYAEAAQSFERAHALSGAPELLYDLGMASDRLREDERTLTAFEAFVAALPESGRARALGPRIEALRRNVRPAAELTTPTLSAAEPAPPPVVASNSNTNPSAQGNEDEPEPSKVLPITLLAVAGASVAGSVGTALWWRDRGKAQDKCDSAECLNSNDIERQRNTAIAMTVTLGTAAVALAATGGVLLARARRSPSRTQVSLSATRATFGALVRHEF